ncbi:hypothetical protein LEM8419_00559 [Neolewinella maritima]|uniref:Glycosyltransferase 2-like domain-containing protein n=1 Tax=Neolewinella maritima TaxID=1383882 RepID=A0ABM9AX07_9BACT|nr:glycosyltransferase [Neolewinella maritima]CAH0999262.1 hypothetical protein LEM8419_00559 [Neolewinella maritima]
MLLTVVICTYHREELLALSLTSLAQQSADPDRYTVLVVDNAGREATRQVAERFSVGYTTKAAVGLSHARNRGLEAAATPWVLYLDDDIQAPPDLLQRFLDRLDTADFAALGGMVRHWFRDPPPRWLRRYYRRPMRPSPQAAFGELAADRYLLGGLLAVRRRAGQKVGGFSARYGMQGRRVGRGDEDEFQVRLRRAGFGVYYDPEIVIDHLVQPYKYTFAGILQLARAAGRDGLGMRGNTKPNRWQVLRRLAIITGYSLPFNLARWLFKPQYYWQNAYLDTLTKYYFLWGQYHAQHTLNSR